MQIKLRQSYNPRLYKLLTPSDPIREFLLQALAFDDRDDPQRNELWKLLYREARQVAMTFYHMGKTEVTESDIIDSWLMTLQEDTSLPQILIDDLQCGFKTISQEFEDNGLQCIAIEDHERFDDDYHEAPHRTPEQIIEDSRDFTYRQDSPELCGRDEYPFLNGMYENTLSEPWGGWDYSHITTEMRRKYHGKKPLTKRPRRVSLFDNINLSQHIKAS